MNLSFKHITRLLCVLLVSLYTTVYVGWNMLHARVHQDEAISHSAQIEKDSCHRSVFHGEQDTHKNHISSNTHCASCHVIVPLPIPAVGTTIPAEIFTTKKEVVPTVVTTDQLFARLFSSRAPPRFV